MENCKKTAKGIGSTGKAENGWKDVEDMLAGLHVQDVLKTETVNAILYCSEPAYMEKLLSIA